MQPLVRVFLNPSSDATHGRRRQAALAFFGLWLFTNFCAVQCNYLLLNVEALLLLNTAVSLGGVVVATSLSSARRSQTEGRTSYPFTFGYSRVAILFRAAAACFVVFGCATLLLEAFHRAMHVHHTQPVLIALCGCFHLLLVLYYRQEVLLCDRVVGPGGARDCMCKEEELVDSVCTLKSEKDENAADVNQQKNRRAGRTARLLLLPVCILATLALRVLESFAHSRVDIIVALFLALYYGYVSCRQADWMLWLLLNNHQQDPHVKQAFDAAMKESVLSLEGVLSLLGCAVWHVNAQDKMCLVRLQVAAGASPARITARAREALAPLCGRVLVECYGLGETPQPFVTQQVEEHDHSHTHSHAHAHAHGESCGGAPDHDHTHAHTHAHAHAHGNDLPVRPLGVAMDVDEAPSPPPAQRSSAPVTVSSMDTMAPGRGAGSGFKPSSIVVLGIKKGAAPSTEPTQTYMPQYKPFAA